MPGDVEIGQMDRFFVINSVTLNGAKGLTLCRSDA